MKKIFLLLVVVVCLAFRTGQEPQFITIRLSVTQADLVIKALRKLPYEESATLIQDIVSQAQKQLTDTTHKKK